MAAPAPNSLAALSANPFGSGEHPAGSCLDDPNFATICSFIEKFGEIVRIGPVPFDELQLMLENSAEVPLPLVQLHITLLRRVFKTVSVDRWERSLAKFGHTYCSQDAWEIERFGYKKAKIQTKLRMLKNLLEAQFDYNAKFKSEVNKLEAADLRLTPLGRDTEGQVYWYQVDADANLRVYREDVDDETWEIVATSKEELVDLISQLQRGEVKKPEPEGAIILPEEDSNGKDIETKEIILDTGKVDDDLSNGEESGESEVESDDQDVKPVVDGQESTGRSSVNYCVKGGVEENGVKGETDVKSTSITSELSSKPGIGLKLVFGIKPRPKVESIVLKIESSKASEKVVEPKSNPETSSSCTTNPDPCSDPKQELKEKEISDINNPASLSGSISETQRTKDNLIITKNISESEDVVHAVSKSGTEMQERREDHHSKVKEVVQLKAPLVEAITAPSENLPDDKMETENTPEPVSVSVDSLSLGQTPKTIKSDLEIELATPDKQDQGSPPLHTAETLQEVADLVASSQCELEDKSGFKEIACKEDISQTDPSVSKEEPNEKSSSDSKCDVDQLKINEATRVADSLMDLQTTHVLDPGTQSVSINSSIEPAATLTKSKVDMMEIEISRSHKKSPERKADDGTLHILSTDQMTSQSNDGEVVPATISETSMENIAVDEKENFTSEKEEVCENISMQKTWECGTPDPPGRISATNTGNTPEEVKVRDFASEKEEVHENISVQKTWVCGTPDPPGSISDTNAENTPAEVKRDFASEKEEVLEKISVKKTWVCGNPEAATANSPPAIADNETTVKDQSTCQLAPLPSAVMDTETKSNDPEQQMKLAETHSGDRSDLVTNKELIIKTDEIKVSQSHPEEVNDSEICNVVEPSKAKVEDPAKKSIEIPKLSNQDTASSLVKSSLVLYSESSEDSDQEEVSPSLSTDIDTQKVSATNACIVTEDLDSLPKPDIEKSEKRAKQHQEDKKSSLKEATVHENTQRAVSESTGCRSEISPVEEAPVVGKNDLDNVSKCRAVVAEDTTTSDLKSDINMEKVPQLSNLPKRSSCNEGLEVPAAPSSVEQKLEDDMSPSKAPTDSLKEEGSTIDKAASQPNPAFSSFTSSEMQSNNEDGTGSETPNTGKRRAEDDIESLPKHRKLDEVHAASSTPVPFNPIVGETIEEEVMTITGEGSGALNEGSNENSPAPLTADVPGSHNDSIESEESREAFPTTRGRGGRRGRGRGGRRGGGSAAGAPTSTPKSSNRGLREVTRLGVSLESFETNGDRENERPVRASRRIAQIRLKEEEERRKLEEERLAQLKAAQIQKKAKLAEKDKRRVENSSKVVSLKGKKGARKSELPVNDYIPSGSESEDHSEEDDGSDNEFSGKGKGRHRRRKNGKAKKGGNPWATSSDDDEEDEAVEEEEEYHYEEEEEELVFKSDHEFSPESDLGDDDDISPSRHARTAKLVKGDTFEEGNCCKCGKGDHPEWILLCDKCDKGWHASCLRPQLWVVPEGEWFCPPCQHDMLIDNLSKNLVEYEGLLKRRENEILRKQRLAYVGISLDNVLPDKEKPEQVETKHVERSSHEKRKQRRRILSDEEDELSDSFINDGSDDNLSRSRTNSTDSEDEPTYRLRARRTKKAFDFKEYDDMINSALRVDDDEEGEEVDPEDIDQMDVDENGEEQLNGDEGEVHSGKNEAYLKHLEEQAQEENETDEELLDEKERLRRRELKKSSHRKTRRRINDLDAYSEEDSDDDFKASEAEDDEEEIGDDDAESEWSGDKMEEDSDDSIAKHARRKERHGRLGRREKYSDKGLVRRSTRKRKSRISYDESDEDEEEEEDQADKWQSGEETEEESESNSESDDESWGKRKKKGFAAAAKPKMPSFLAENAVAAKPKGAVKKKRRKADEDDVDKAWNSSARGRRQKDEPVERRTRGRKINFKDILDSGESDDEGNVRPKRRPLSDSEDSRSPSSSRKLAEEIRAENLRQAKEYEDAKKAETGDTVQESESENAKPASTEMPLSMNVAKLAESSVNNASPPKAPPPTSAIVSQLSALPHVSPAHSPTVPTSPVSLPVSSSPLPTVSNSSPVHTVPPAVVQALVSGAGPSTSLPASTLQSALQASLPTPHLGSLPLVPPLTIGLPKTPPILSFSPTSLNLSSGSPLKLMAPLPQPLPTPPPETKPPKAKGSKSKRNKSEKGVPTDLELALMKPVKGPPPVVSPSSKSSSKKKETAPINVPNPNLLIAGGALPELLGQSLALRASLGAPNLSGSSSSKKSSSGNSSSAGNTSHSKSSGISSRTPNSSQQTPPPVQNLSPTLPVDIDRIPNPALFQGNPAMRPFPSMWTRTPGLPPPAYTTAGSSIASGGLGKPPPLNTSPFGGQPGPRAGYPSPPPLRIPNPSPLQAFQHFKRDSPIGGPLYRLPAGQPQSGVSLANLLPGMMSPHSAGPERFFGAPSAYGHPYGLLPPHTQAHHPQPLFTSPYDYRPPDLPFKEEPIPSRSSSSGSSHSTPVTGAPSSPPPAPTGPSKEEASGARDSEFGGLVSYFSSQRSEEDMDT